MKKPFYTNIDCVHSGVTGSCIRVEVHYPDGEKTTFLVDCGIFQESRYSYYNSRLPFDPKDVDFVLVTHAHADHIGRIPMLTKHGFNGSIYCTDTTAKIMKYALDDTYHVLKDNGTLWYHHNDVDDAMSLVHPYKFSKKKFHVDEDDNITVTFIMNGHLVGAAMILVTIKHYSQNEEINLLFTGDYKDSNLFFDVPEIGDKIKAKNLTIISEATYGNTDSSEMKKVFRKNIISWAEKGGTIYLPVFALGRCQEMLYIIGSLKNVGMIDYDIPVYLDGTLAAHYCNLFRVDKLNNDVKMMTNLYPSFFQFINSKNNEERKQIMEDESQKIVLFTSGMCSYGPARSWIPYGYQNENVLIHLTGYPAEGTMARALVDTEEGKKVEIFGSQKVTKKCKIMCTNEFSGHAKADQLIELYKKFDNCKSIILNHGDTEEKEALKKKILEETEVKDVGILGRSGYRVDAYGISKEIPNELFM